MIQVERDGAVATVILKRPEKLNAISAEMRAQLQDTWRDLSADPAVGSLVVTGAGERAFCVGNDLTGANSAQDSFPAEVFGPGGGDSLTKGLDPDLPVVAALNGYAIGGGLEIALACDIRIASSNAEFGLPEVRVGSIPGAGGTQLLPRLIGRSMAMHMLLTGERISAQRAYEVGLVSEVHPLTDLLPRALDIAHRIARNAPLSIRSVKRLVRLGDNAPLSSALATERYAFGLIKSTQDRSEGRAAFSADREPRYEGR